MGGSAKNWSGANEMERKHKRARPGSCFKEEEVQQTKWILPVSSDASDDRHSPPPQPGSSPQGLVN